MDRGAAGPKVRLVESPQALTFRTLRPVPSDGIEGVRHGRPDRKKDTPTEGSNMPTRLKIASLVTAGAMTVVAGLTAAAPAQADAAADQRGTLRNAGTGLCLDWSGSLNPGNVTNAVTTTCTGSKTQLWTYSAADHLIRNTDTAYCAATGNTNAVFITTCSGQWGEHWGYTSDGRFHQLDWTTGCMQDDKSLGPDVTWTGVCRNTDIEVWQHAAA
jgi:hypothetical protein